MHEQVIDLQDVQGLVRGYGRSVPKGEFLLLRILDADGFRKCLRALGAPTTMEEWPPGRSPKTATNVAFTYAGLEALGLPAALLETFPDDFKQGMRRRSAINLDVGASAPEHWEPWWRAGGVHVWIGVYAADCTALQHRVAEILDLAGRFAGAAGPAFAVECRQPVAIIEANGAVANRYGAHTKLEHFGFADGLSEPAIEGVARPHDYAGSKRSLRYPASRWLPLAPGEFLLGHYKDEADERPVGPAAPELATNGTFMIYRKLAQDVRGFWAHLEQLADRVAVDAVDLAERMVGRRRDGTPLVRTNADGEDVGRNGFDYSNDPHGEYCPLGAHIRRANPRDAFGFGTVLVDRHRILRRGIPYGPFAPDPREADPAVERGLVFIALNASIARQFEFVQRRWMNDGQSFNIGNDRDPIAGQLSRDARFVLNAPRGHAQGVTICTGLKSFVTTRGGDYFFLPGLGGLRYLAEGSYHL